MRTRASLLAVGACAGSLLAGMTAAATAPPTSEPAASVARGSAAGQPRDHGAGRPGGGWDSTARAMQTVLDPMIDGSVEVTNVPGAGGTIGLAEFAGDSGSGTDLMVMGSVMVGAIITNDSPVTLESSDPIASLTTEYLAVVVPADSDLQTFEDLVAAFQEDPRADQLGRRLGRRVGPPTRRADRPGGRGRTRRHQLHRPRRRR